MTYCNINKLIIIATEGLVYPEWRKALVVKEKNIYGDNFDGLHDAEPNNVRFIELKIQKCLLILLEEDNRDDHTVDYYLDKLWDEGVGNIREKYLAVHHTKKYFPNACKYKDAFAAICNFHHVYDENRYFLFFNQLERLLDSLIDHKEDDACNAFNEITRAISILAAETGSEGLSDLIHSLNNRFAALRVDSQTLANADDNVSIEIYNGMFGKDEGYLTARNNKETVSDYLRELETKHGTKIYGAKNGGKRASEIFDLIIERNAKRFNKKTFKADVNILVDAVNKLETALRETRQKEIDNAL